MALFMRLTGRQIREKPILTRQIFNENRKLLQILIETYKKRQNRMTKWQAMKADKFILDSLDHELVGLLRQDGRASLSKLAEQLKVSRGTVQNRLDRLIASGTLLGFTARMREDYDDDQVRAVMMVEIVGKSTADIVRKLRGLPQVRSIHSTNGNWDLIAEIHASSLSDFDDVLRKVRMIDGILNSETNLLLAAV